MRAAMTPEELRAAGVYLNAGRRRGWKKRLSLLLNTPEATISAWATRSPGNARPIPGVAATAVKLLTALVRQEVAARGDLAAAAQALVEQVAALTRRPEPLPAPAQPILRLDPVPPERPPLAVPVSQLGLTERRLRRQQAARPGPQPPSAAPAEGGPIKILPRGGKFENRPQ